MAASSGLIAISGCDTGFGLMLASRLAANGHRVLAGCLTAESGSGLSELPSVTVHALDVTDTSSIERFRLEAERLGGGLVGLVNNAGIIACECPAALCHPC